MSSQVVLTQRNNREAIAVRIRDGQKGITLYSPDKEWREVPALGRSILFPPDLGGELVQHPRALDEKTQQPLLVQANGRVEVVDHYGYKMIKKRKRMVMFSSALDAVTHILGKRQDIAHLSGDKAADQKAIEEAKRVRMAQKIHGARNDWKTRTDFIARWLTQHPGEDPPPPTDRQIAAQALLNENQTTAKWKTFYCRKCYLFQHDDFAPYQKHMKDKHDIVELDPRVARPKPLPIDLKGKAEDAIEE